MANEMRLIDANALKDRMGEAHFHGYGDAIMLVMDAPTVDAAPVVHGRWEDRPTGRYGARQSWCSACGKHSGIGGIESNRHRAYCPNCGAKMDGGGEGG